MFGKKSYQDINRLLNQKFQEKRVLIAVHRGAWGGNIIENTALSYRLADEMGADMFECDISRSTDGVLYAFHDGGEKRMLKMEQNIESLSAAEIEALVYYNSIGQPSGIGVETFESVVAGFCNGELYNVDRAWDKMPETVAVLDRYPWALEQALIKSPVREDVLRFLNVYPRKYMYMPIVYSMKDVETVLSYPDINTVGMELIAVNTEDDLFMKGNIDYIHSRQLFTWANAITLSGLKEHVLYGGLDDDMALMQSKDAAWGEMLRKGINVIQTDWPVQLKQYRDRYFADNNH